MKNRRLILSLSIIIVICFYPGASKELSSEAVSDQGYTWYSLEASSGDGRLMEDGPQFAKEVNNSLFIVDYSGMNKRTFLELPKGSWASLRLAPIVGGNLELYCLYPTGSISQINSETVSEDRIYKAGFHAGIEGDYEIWYTINGTRSNSVKLLVQGDLANETAPKAGAAGTGPGKALSRQMAYSYAAAAPLASPGIGFSAGGAKDINNFRENIDQGYLPLPTDVTYEGLFYDYYFETGAPQECEKLFCPSYSYAVSKDPISEVPQYYLSVGLNSGITDFQRKKLNLVVVLDFSGSMGSPFDQYYYDRFGNRVEDKVDESGKTKMQLADESVVALLDHLKPEDRFGLVVFSDDAFLVDPLTNVGDKDLDRLKSRILEIKETDGTNMESGMEEGTILFDRFLQANKSDYENRIIFLTDAMPNLGETADIELFRMLEDNADHGIYTTFVGIGVDFNTELVEEITKIRGANYYSVHSASEFKKRMDNEFDFMVTPLVFDLRLKLDAPGYEIEKVYGSPEGAMSTGELMKVNTLFPSPAEDGQVKGGVILVKLKRLSSDGTLRLLLSYQDRNGMMNGDEAKVIMPNTKSDLHQNNGIRKSILLSRYADLLKNWVIDERKALEKGWQVVPSITLANGIVVPIELGEWERQSRPLQVSDPYRVLFAKFSDHFQKEMEVLKDPNLAKEELILKKLSTY